MSLIFFIVTLLPLGVTKSLIVALLGSLETGLLSVYLDAEMVPQEK